jgi:formiminotetrahydrofolate cyclodeaminase
MLGEISIQELYRRSASTDPAPGGGSVTALTGMLGIALVLKALRISLKRREDAASFQQADRALEALAGELARDADADAETFAAFIAALQLPKTSPEETAERARRLEAAAVASTEAGLLALEHAVEAMRRSRELEDVISKTMAPDLDAGLRLLDVLKSNAIHNAEANLASVKAPDQRVGLAGRLEALRGA